jgi:hypothetical protein
MVITV